MAENTGRGLSNLQEEVDVTGPGDRERSISMDRVLSAVSNEHRRAILHSLNSGSDGAVEYDTLVASVADEVGDDDAAGVSDDHRQHIRIALHHNHLPKLEEARIIDYDVETGHVQFIGSDLELDILATLEAYDAGE